MIPTEATLESHILIMTRCCINHEHEIITKTYSDCLKEIVLSDCIKCPTVKVKVFVSHSFVSDSATPWTIIIDHQAPLPMEFSRQDYWNGQLSSSRDLPDPGIKLDSPTLQADSLPTEPPGKPISKNIRL